MVVQKDRKEMKGAHMYFECYPFANVPLYKVPFKQKDKRIPQFGNEKDIFKMAGDEHGFLFDFDRITSVNWSPSNEPLRGVLDFFARLNPIFLGGRKGHGFFHDHLPICGHSYLLDMGKHRVIAEISLDYQAIPSVDIVREELERDIRRDITKAIGTFPDNDFQTGHFTYYNTIDGYRGLAEGLNKNLEGFVKEIVDKHWKELVYHHGAIDENTFLGYLAEKQGQIYGLRIDLSLFADSEKIPVRYWFSRDKIHTVSPREILEHFVELLEGGTEDSHCADLDFSSKKYEHKSEVKDVKRTSSEPILESC